MLYFLHKISCLMYIAENLCFLSCFIKIVCIS
jgi:hypothetical protein